MNDTANQPSQTPDLAKLISDVKRDILFQIILNMRKGEISLKESQHLSRDFLALFPVSSKEDLLEKLKSLGNRYKEANAVYLTYASPEHEKKDQDSIAQMLAHIRDGNFDKALEHPMKGDTNG